MDVVGATGWLAALAVRPDGGQPRPAEEALALVSTLARRLADEHAAGTVHGASLPPTLRAPEVLAGAEPGPAADVYALTAGLWTMLAGRPPHVAADEDDVPADVLATRRADPPDDVPDLPAPVTALLLRGLAVDPADRPADAAELAAALEDCSGLVDYARRRELGQRFRPRPVTPRPGPDAATAAPTAAAGQDRPAGPVTPVDPLPVLRPGRRGRRAALLLAALAVAAGVAVVLVPGLRGAGTVPRPAPRPTGSFDSVAPAGAVPTSAVPAGTVPAGAPSGPAAGTGPSSGAAGSGGSAPVGGTAPLPGASTGGAGPAGPGSTGTVPTGGTTTTTSSSPPSTTTSTRTPVRSPTRQPGPTLTETLEPPPTA